MPTTIMNAVHIPYDTLNPDKNLTDFLSFLRAVKMRYEGNAREQQDKEAQLQDLEHYVELHSDLDCKGGYKAHKDIREVRRARRGLKQENELLNPLYEWINLNEQALNSLTQTLGKVRKTAEVIEGRRYTTRTDVLEDGTG